MGILKDMYTGNQSPFGELNIESKEFADAVSNLSLAENELLKQHPEIRTLFKEYQKALGRVDEIVTYTAFKNGFRAGSQLMQEMLKPID